MGKTNKPAQVREPAEPVGSSMVLASRARAKINLTLHIPRRRDDGWHEVVSLVAFAGCGDHLALAPGADLTLTVTGPMSAKVAPHPDNLVLGAARHLSARIERLRVGRFHLIKRLPVAAGIGGGSADAAAALRLLATANGIASDDPLLLEAARQTGADVPVCLAATARMMEGLGERLGPPVRLPILFAVLVNPGVALQTRAVFACMGRRPGETRDLGEHPMIPDPMRRESLMAALRKARNDMEDAATVMLPIIGHQLAMLAAARGCLLARMSGSGPTCFGLFTERRAAAAAARVIKSSHPEWWVKATVLR